MHRTIRRRLVRTWAAASAGALVASLVSGCDSTPAPPPAVDQYVEGVQALKRGDQETAIRDLQAAIAQKPDLRMARTVLGQIYRDRNDYANAVPQYEALTKLDPYTVKNHYYLGVSYQFLRNYSAAVRAYLAGLAIDPADFRSNMNVGTVMLAAGDVDGAIKYLDKATQLDPKSAAAWSNLGVAFDARGSYVFGETAYRRAVALESDAPSVLQNLANNLLIQQKGVEATYLWEQIVKKTPTPFNRTKLAAAYTVGGDFDRAAPLIDDVLKQDARYVPAVNAKANLLIRKYELSGFVDDASRRGGLDLYRRSLNLNGEQPQVREQIKKYAQALPLQ